MNINVGSVAYSINKQLSTIVRYGMLRSMEKNSTTNSDDLGQEYDFSLLHNITPSTELQFDFAYFQPGKYFTHKDDASLTALKLKFIF